MYLEKLEINGFKSFARKTGFNFKPGITAIVGPNGSGKSNIADAMRWALGEQSIKTLRGKKSEDVIFSGSDKKARLGMAEIALYFNNEKDEADIGMSEICITRRLYRNGDSEYLINNAKSRLADIQMLLAKTGVAHTSYSIIGQGMIDSFLLSSPQERKEFFEEASGVKPLQIKRGQSLNKLERTEENLETAQIQLNEITPRLNSLTRQVKRLEKRAEIEIQLKDLEKKYYGSLLNEINKKWQTENNELKKEVAEQDALRSKTNELQEQIAKLTKDSVKSEKLEGLNKELQALVEDKMKYNSDIAEIKVKAVQTVVKDKDKKNIPAYISGEIIKYIKDIKDIKDKINTALNNNNLEEAKKQLYQQEVLIDKINKTLEPFTENKNSAVAKTDFNLEIEKLENKIKEINQTIENTQQQIKSENEKEKNERSQIWEFQQSYQNEQSKLNEISNVVNNLRVELARLETRKDDLEQEARQELNDLEEIKNKDYPALNENEKRTMVTEIGKLKHSLELIGGIDPEVQTEYEQTKERHGFLDEQIKDLNKSMEVLEKLILDLDENIKKQFDNNFKKINDQFQKYFKVLFDGGKSQLILIKNDQDPSSKLQETRNAETEGDAINRVSTEIIEEGEAEKIKDRLKSTVYAGIEIEATPPGKKLKSINMLSGGEKAMTSIALICAIISSNPSPFIVLDEVDAALDEANSLRYAEILEKLSEKSQLLIITHNRATMEKSDILYGVTMGDDGISELLSLKLETAEKFTNR
ncbi:chromosome segregation SMC family protein [Patescibacteria group bacterium]